MSIFATAVVRAIGLTAVFGCVLSAGSVSAGSITVKGPNAPVITLEDQKGLSILFTITNTSSDLVSVTGITKFDPFILSGETDDSVANVGITSVPVPFFVARNGGTANFRLTFDTPDPIHDNDVDKGVWDVGGEVAFTSGGVADTVAFHATVEVNDPKPIPLPPAAMMGGFTLLGILGLGGFNKFRTT